MARLWVLLQIAFRNLLASKMNLIIGFIMLAGTTLVVVGTAMFDSLDRAMASSITSSVAGHLQVYSSKSKDELAIFGGMNGQDPDLAPIQDFPKVKAAIQKLPNVRQVVPMGFANAMITSGNTVDLTLAHLRENVKERAAGPTSPEQQAETESLKAHVRELARLLRRDLENTRKISDAVDPESIAVAETVAGEAFWKDFDARADEKLEFLENKLAQLMADGDMIFMRYAGTDLDAYRTAFDRFEIVDGQAVPPGQRGMLIGKYFYEEAFKLRPARRLDQLKEAIDVNGKKIAADPDLQRRIKELSQQTNTIVYQLDPLKQRRLVERLQQGLGSKETDPDKLLQELMQLTDANFSERYRLFYAEVAPLVELYRVRIGDEISLQSMGRSGYAQAANVKVWGTFQFKALENSPLASATNLVDLVTFGDLYGYMSPDRVAEIRSIQEQTGAGEVSRENAEAALFGEDTQLVAEASQAELDESALLGGRDRTERPTTFTPQDLEQALTLDAAVLLHDPDKLDETAQQIRELAEREGFALKVMDWQDAAGLLGDMTLVARLLLIVIALVIFVVAVVIINNAMMMATMQRVREIGTLRAIGSQKGFVLTMVLLETAVLGTVFGLVGAGVGAALLGWWGRVGIPAANEQLYIFFGGPRLFPEMGWVHVGIAFAVVLIVSAISALYPAFLATRVAPVTAMQSAEE